MPPEHISSSNEKQEERSKEQLLVPERRPATVVEVYSYLDATTDEEFLETVIRDLKGLPEYIRIIRLNNVGLSLSSTDQDLRVAVQQRIAEYRVVVEKVRESIISIFSSMKQWFDANGFLPQQEPGAVPTHVIDRILGRRGGGHSVFDPVENRVYFGSEDGLHSLAHEYIHAAARNATTKMCGFRSWSDPSRFVGNRWLDEGCTIIGEFAVYPTKESRKRDAPDERYEEFFWLTQRWREQLGINEEDLMKAYFGQEPYRQNLEQAVSQKFGCTITDLNSLLILVSRPGVAVTEDIERSKRIIEKILNGSPVILEAADSYEEQQFFQLARIFPHVTVEKK